MKPYIERPEITAEREAGWVNFHPEDICHACGGENPPWHADTEQWYQAMGVRDTDGGGIVCPNCFIALWHGTTDRNVIWRLSIMERDTEGFGAVVYLRELARRPCYCESEHPEKEPSPICLPCAAARALVDSGHPPEQNIAAPDTPENP